MIHVPIVLGMKIALAIYRNRVDKAAGLQSVRVESSSRRESLAGTGRDEELSAGKIPASPDRQATEGP